jgi:hypothetical protein
MRRELALTAVVVAAAALAGVGLFATLKPEPNTPAAAAIAGDAPSRVEGASSIPSPTSADPRAGHGLGLDEVVHELDLIRPSRAKRAEDFTVALLRGETLKLREQRGKAVLINF